MLFLPGLTTHHRADLLAGRGLGLDLVQDTVRRLGGTIRLRSRAGGGLTASFEMPSDQTVVEVLWLEELGQRFALPVSFTGRVEPSGPSLPTAVRLARCLGQKCAENPAVSLELTVYGVTPIRIGLDGVGEIEQVALRALPDLIAERGPYGGAVLRSDGTLALGARRTVGRGPRLDPAPASTPGRRVSAAILDPLIARLTREDFAAVARLLRDSGLRGRSGSRARARYRLALGAAKPQHGRAACVLVGLERG